MSEELIKRLDRQAGIHATSKSIGTICKDASMNAMFEAADRISALIAAGDKLAGYAGHGKRSDGEACSFAWVGAPCDCGLTEAVKAWRDARDAQ